MKTAKAELKESISYDSFRYSPDQRDISLSHVRDIMASMQTWGFLPSKPLQTYKDGSKFVIIDGHHRFVAAKNLQIPVLFVVESKENANSIGDVNGPQRKWGLYNFVSMYAKRGIPEYKELLEYHRLGIPFSIASGLLSGKSGATSGVATHSKSVIDGTFKIKTREKIEVIADFIRDHGHKNPCFVNRAFLISLELLMRIEEFDFDRLRSKLANNPKTLVKMATTEQMLYQLEEIYNYHQSIKVSLAFMAKGKMYSKKAK